MAKPFSLIVCTYMRPNPLLRLLMSVKNQSLYPDEILIIDGSTNNETKQALKENNFENLKYFKVEAHHRGLTKQRNYGIKNVSDDSEIVCFLDDDTVLEKHYFENLIGTYDKKKDALGVGGYIINEVKWEKADIQSNPKKFYFDGWMRDEPFRFRLRKKLGLLPNVAPGFSPLFSHARSIGFLPPTGKIYDAELLMGGVSSFKKDVFKTHLFSTFFEGYGLYEDADFSIRVAKTGPLFVNTSAQLSHFHEGSGRPNQYKYGKMVVRNGYHIWRTKVTKPSFKVKLKWHAITLLLILIRFSNVFTTAQKKEAFTETLGRTVGWFRVLMA